MSLRIVAVLLGSVVLACASLSSAFASNNPIPGIDVVVQKQPGGSIVARTTTDAKGEFTVKELPAGRYIIQVSGKGLEPAKLAPAVLIGVLAFTKDGKPGRLQNYQAKPGNNSFQVDFVAPEGQPLTYKGTVTIPDGGPAGPKR